MKKNIRFVLLGELILFLAVFFLTLYFCNDDPVAMIPDFIDLPSLLGILIISVPGLFITGEMKDFIKSFSVGIRHYGLLELKNIINAVGAAQKLTIYGALFMIITENVLFMHVLSNVDAIGPNISVMLLTAFYAAIIEFFLLPLKLNAERKMNEEMDLDDAE